MSLFHKHIIVVGAQIAVSGYGRGRQANQRSDNQQQKSHPPNAAPGENLFEHDIESGEVCSSAEQNGYGDYGGEGSGGDAGQEERAADESAGSTHQFHGVDDKSA